MDIELIYENEIIFCTNQDKYNLHKIIITAGPEDIKEYNQWLDIYDDSSIQYYKGIIRDLFDTYKNNEWRLLFFEYNQIVFREISRFNDIIVLFEHEQNNLIVMNRDRIDRASLKSIQNADDVIRWAINQNNIVFQYNYMGINGSNLTIFYNLTRPDINPGIIPGQC